MKTLDQVIRLLEELQRKFTSNKAKLDRLEELNEQQLDEARKLLVQSAKAQDIALHSFRVDHNGFIWRWDAERKEYVKTKARVNMPVVPDESIKAHQIANEAIEERHLSKGLIAWLKELMNGANGANGAHRSCNVFLTQGEYDALEDKDENVTYFIYEEDGTDEPGGGGGDEPGGGGGDEPGGGGGDGKWRLGDRMPLVLE